MLAIDDQAQASSVIERSLAKILQGCQVLEDVIIMVQVSSLDKIDMSHPDTDGQVIGLLVVQPVLSREAVRLTQDHAHSVLVFGITYPGLGYPGGDK